MAVERDQACPARLRRLAMPSSLPPATTISPPGVDPLDRLGDAHFVLARDGGRKHQRGVEAIAFGARRDLEARTLQRQEMRPEALHQRSSASKPSGRRKPGSAPRNSTRASLRRQRRQHAGLERMEQGLQCVAAHRLGRTDWLTNEKGATLRPRPFQSLSIRPIRRRFLRLRPSCRGRFPCRWPGRRPSSTGGPCRARRSPSA